MRTIVATRFLVGTCLSVSAPAAIAQVVPATPPAEAGPSAAETPPATAQGASGEEDTVVVTGSRLVTSGANAPTPVSVLTTENLVRTAPTNLADALNQQPVFQGSLSPGRGDSVQSNRVRSGNYLNLRALGTSRVLVLQDGHRLVPTGNNGGTDANLVPQLLIERVDVVTGGASAAYGSDAVSGVVNFVTAKKFDGVRTLLQTGITTQGDNPTWKAAIAGGTSLFDDRLHLVASAEHFDQAGIENRCTRRGCEGWSYGGLGTPTSPFAFYSDVRSSNNSDNGYIATGPLAGRQFALGGTTVPFRVGTLIGRNGVMVGGDGATNRPELSNLTPSLVTDQLFGRATFEVAPGAELFGEIGYNTARNVDRPAIFNRQGNLTIFRENAYLAPTTLAALGTMQSFGVNRAYVEFGSNDAEQRVRSLNIHVGLRGELGGFRWDAAYTRGRSHFESDSIEPELSRLYAAQDAVRAANGSIVCRVTVTNPGRADGCVPIDIFGLGAITTEARNYILQHSIWKDVNRLDEISANVTGTLAQLWAGPLSFAIGGNYRRQSFEQTSNSDPTVVLDRTGIRGVTPTTRFWLTNVGQARGGYTIKEQYIELELPLLKESSLGRSLVLNAAGRNTDYSTSGGVRTWKVGGVYEPIDGLRARATLSRDIRAPSLFELFAGQTIVSAAVTDALTGGSGNVPAVSGGNSDLQPERATTVTAGLVVTPALVPGLSASIDYYDIKIDSAIAVPYGAQAALNVCFASGNTGPACDIITRPLGPTNTSATNFPTRISQVPLNLSELQTRGFDVELGYRSDVGAGRLETRLLATRLISYKTRQNPTSSAVENANTADLAGAAAPIALPKWRVTASSSYELDGFTIGAQARLLGAFQKSRILTYVDNDMPVVVYGDLNLSYRFAEVNGRPEFFLTVNNITNNTGPFWPYNAAQGLFPPVLKSLYDIDGRYFTLGVRTRF